MHVSANNFEQLMLRLGDDLPASAISALQQENIKVAVNQQLIEQADYENCSLCFDDGDEVAFLPPVTGG